MARLTKVDGVSRLADDISLLNLTCIPLVLSNHIVSLTLCCGGLPTTAVLELEIVLLHAIPSILLSVCVAL